MEILEKITSLYQKFSSLKISKEEYVIMKVINYLNQGKQHAKCILQVFVTCNYEKTEFYSYLSSCGNLQISND